MIFYPMAPLDSRVDPLDIGRKFATFAVVVVVAFVVVVAKDGHIPVAYIRNLGNSFLRLWKLKF